MLHYVGILYTLLVNIIWWCIILHDIRLRYVFLFTLFVVGFCYITLLYIIWCYFTLYIVDLRHMELIYVPMKHRISWYRQYSITKKFIDFSISGSNVVKSVVTDVRLYNSVFESDHRLLTTKLTTPTNKTDRFCPQRPRKTPRYI